MLLPKLAGSLKDNQLTIGHCHVGNQTNEGIKASFFGLPFVLVPVLLSSVV
jgi:hypothetical protein